jgi:cyclic-di-AMP phosphodiesterase PgpH
MLKKYAHLILATALIITLCQLVFNPYRSWNRALTLNVGQIAEQDIISPIEFSVYKSSEILKREREEAAGKVSDIYSISDNITYNAIRNLDIIIRHFENLSPEATWQEISLSLQQKGYRFSQNAIEFLTNSDNLSTVYSYLSEKIARIFDIGIYPESYTGSTITVKRKSVIRDYYLFKLYGLTEARDKLIDGFINPSGLVALQDMVDNILVVNIVYDREATEQKRQMARLEVETTAGKVLKNEAIIRKGERVDEEHLQKINSLQQSLKNSNIEHDSKRVLMSAAGTFIIVLLMIFILFNMINQFSSEREFTSNRMFLLLFLLISVSLITLLINNILDLSALLIPLGFFSFAVLKLCNRKIAYLYTIIQFIIVSILLNWNYTNPLLLSISSLPILMVSNKNRINFPYLAMCITMLIFFFIFTLGLSLNQVTRPEEYFQRLLYGSISIILSTLLAVLILPYLEKRFKIVTREQLMELLDQQHPLIKRMRQEIPGTYHHSIIVGNLAESAAEAIEADHLLARAGSYFHDLGKLVNHLMFIENNPEASDLHNEMLPTQSAHVIRNHILEGVKIAREEGLPEAVIEIIIQHHGTSTIRFFLSKAKETHQNHEAEEFRYPGPKPQTKEAAIVMIADIVESHSKSLSEVNPGIIDHLLEDTINKLIREGQLNEAPVTISELRKVINAMHPILMGVYSTRIEYPADEE